MAERGDPGGGGAAGGAADASRLGRVTRRQPGRSPAPAARPGRAGPPLAPRPASRAPCQTVAAAAARGGDWRAHPRLCRPAARSTPPSSQRHAHPPAATDMAHAPASCPSFRGSGDGEMGKPRKVALITGITGQVSAGRGRAASGRGARGPPPRAGRPGHGELPSAHPGRCAPPPLRGEPASAGAACLACSASSWGVCELVLRTGALGLTCDCNCGVSSTEPKSGLGRHFVLCRSWCQEGKGPVICQHGCGVALLNHAHLLTCSPAVFGAPAAAVFGAPLTRASSGKETIGVTDYFYS